jgi:hypothetical protein
MKLKLNQDVKKAVEREPEFPKVVYYLLSFSLVLFFILTALQIHVKYEDGSVIPGNYHVAKKIVTPLKCSKGLRRRNLPTAILMGSRGTGLELLKEVLEGHPSLKMVRENLRFFEDGHVFNKGLYWYR